MICNGKNLKKVYNVGGVKNLKKVYNVRVQKSQKGAWRFRKKVTRLQI